MNMNDIEQTHRQIHIINNPLSLTTRYKRSQRQRISPELQPITTTNKLSPVDPIHYSQSFGTTNQIISKVSSSNTDNSNSFPVQSKMTNNHLQTLNIIDQEKSHLSDSLNNTNENNNHDSSNNSPSLTLVHKKNLSTSDFDPFEHKKHLALVKAEAKLEKAQRLYQSAQQSIEQNISEFLRVTTIPCITNEIISSKITNVAFEKCIHTLQETKKELEKKIINYQSDINRIQNGDIPHQYTSSKDILNNIKNKVSNTNSKRHSTNDISTSITNEQSISSNNLDSESNLPTISLKHDIGNSNNNQNLLSYSHNSNTLEPIRPSPSSSISNEIGNSQFYIDSNYDHLYDNDKFNRKHDIIIPGDISAIHDIDKSPSTKRRFTDDSNVEFNDRISDHSNDDRFLSFNASKRNTMATIEYHQLIVKIDCMQKLIDRYELKFPEMQKQIDSLIQINDSQKLQNQRLNNDLTDLIGLHQTDMSSMKTDLKKLEEKLLYNINEYLAEMVEKLDKLDTRTAKVEQNQIHSIETEENTHRVISKLVNILLTVFAIILLLLSTIKNLVQSRVHAVILLILVFIWITIHYLPENYFESSFINLTNMFKRSS